MKYEMVSVKQLKPYIEVDRSKFAHYERYKILKRSIIKDGIREPIWLFIHQKNGKVHIAEGNTRLAIAEELGIENIPARVACFDREDTQNIHKLPPKPAMCKRKIGFITYPSALGFRKK